MLTLYSKPNCVQCNATARKLDQLGIKHDVIDLTEDLNAYRAVKALGYMQAPVVAVTYPDGTVEDWGGYRPDKLTAYAEAIKTGAAA